MKQTFLALPIPPRTPLSEGEGLPRSQLDDLRRFRPEAVLGLPSSGIQLGFTLPDALRCLLGGRDPRFSRAPAPDWDLVFVKTTAQWFDDRYIRPGAASLASESPRLLGAYRQRWADYAVYEHAQGLLLRSDAAQLKGTRLSFTVVERELREQLARDVDANQRARILSVPLNELLSDLPRLLANPEQWTDDFVAQRVH